METASPFDVAGDRGAWQRLTFAGRLFNSSPMALASPLISSDSDRSSRRGAMAALIGAAFLALALVFAPAPRAQLASFGKTELTIETASGKQHFIVEEAKTPQQMAQGLMFRRAMPVDAGMLFEYDRPQTATFWMKNTLIPLDMLFIAADGVVLDIHERAVPMSLDPIASEKPVLAVLELNGGTVSRLGIKRGDRVDHPLFAKGG